MTTTRHQIGPDGPLFDDLEVGDVLDHAPPLRLTDGRAAVHHAIVGGRLRLAFDDDLAQRVTGSSPFAAPAFAWDMAIGQSTLVTQRAIANLFYRGLRFLRAPAIGDTLRTSTTIVGLRPVAAKPGRSPRGLVVMRIETADQEGRPVLDFHRCAMLPAERLTEEARGLVDPPMAAGSSDDLAVAARQWDLDAFRRTGPGPHFADLREGVSIGLAGGDLVSSAAELARLTLNLAVTHHDRTSSLGGERLVYGGHTIGIALSQVTRVLPSLVTIVAWHGCDHTGPVREGDTLHSETTIERLEPLARGGGLAHLRVQVRATTIAGETAPVLDWRPVGLFA